MDKGLFGKYIHHIQKQKSNKEDICIYIKEKTGIELQDKEIQLTKKQITLHISSVLKQKLFQNNIEKFLQEKGYTLKR